MPRFRRYIALGDSISIDLYPYLDLEARHDREPPDEVGAASLLFRNDDELWPEFAGRDLVTLYPGIQKTDLTADAATTWAVLQTQLRDLPDDPGSPVLVTLTAGGNDLLWLLGAEAARGEAELEATIANLRKIVRAVKARYSQLTLLVGNVYDPSDGTADLGDGVLRTREMGWLQTYNRTVVEIAEGEGCVPVDIHGHFMDHGLSVPDPLDRWYWTENIIEPSARGASEVRRLWLEALGV